MINSELCNGLRTAYNAAKHYGVSESAMKRHKRNHLPRWIAARKQTIAAQGSPQAREIDVLLQRQYKALDAAEMAGRAGLAAKISAAILKALALRDQFRRVADRAKAHHKNVGLQIIVAKKLGDLPPVLEGEDAEASGARVLIGFETAQDRADDEALQAQQDRDTAARVAADNRRKARVLAARLEAEERQRQEAAALTPTQARMRAFILTDRGNLIATEDREDLWRTR
ncbi:MAG: hypothetical protein FJX72_13520 [Armatimonadetes bacterium]|nr:hypothetical protein [Armatimonadota bacterium]